MCSPITPTDNGQVYPIIGTLLCAVFVIAVIAGVEHCWPTRYPRARHANSARTAFSA